jgi:cbb3-type cytochrome oxidase maturation protein
MEIIFLLIPLSLLLVIAALWGFFWAAKNGQFDDLDSPALMILEDESESEEATGELTADDHGNAERTSN